MKNLILRPAIKGKKKTLLNFLKHKNKNENKKIHYSIKT